jgi:chorismate dehydratase
MKSSVQPSKSMPSFTHAALRIASVSYLNARPLIDGLDGNANHKLLLEVPAKLIDLLRENLADIALLPVIDYQRMDGLCIVPAGGIGCNGETLTVRIFSKTPIKEIRTLACDIESHTSVALAKIVLAEHFGIQPEFVGLRAGLQGSGFRVQDGNSGSSLNPEPRTLNPSAAQLLIGDKVVCEEPAGFEYQLDLGAAWKEMTGLPFVFAVWTTRVGTDLGGLPQELERARKRGLAHVEDLIRQNATPRGWPADLARQYLTQYLQYDIGEPQLEAIRLFHSLAKKHGVVAEVKPLRLYS